MDWQEELKKVGIVGISGFFGHIFLKYGKKSIHPIRKIFRNAEKVDKIISDSHYLLELTKAILHTSPCPVYMMDTETGNLEYVNPKWCELTGFRDPDDAYGNGWLRSIPDEGLDSIRKVNDDFTRHPSNSEGEIIMVHIYSKEKFKAKFRNEILFDEHKKPFKSLGILTEIVKL